MFSGTCLDDHEFRGRARARRRRLYGHWFGGIGLAFFWTRRIPRPSRCIEAAQRGNMGLLIHCPIGHSDSIEHKLSKRLHHLQVSNQDNAYIVRMWTRALQNIKHGYPIDSEHGAFPYVPIRPEEFGLHLDRTSQVLDVGCLSGYGMYDFCFRRMREGLPVPALVGLDIDADSVALGEELSDIWARGLDTSFFVGTCESIPFADQSFDMIVARVVLPYVHVDNTLAEFARVLRPQGLALIQTHGPRYYLHQLTTSLHRPLDLFYYVRPLVSGLMHRITGRQPDSRWLLETAMDETTLRDACKRHRLRPTWSGHDSRRPIMLFRRDAGAAMAA